MNYIKKSLKDISWQVTEPEYREDPAYSYSTIAKFDREGFNQLDKLFDKVETPSLTFGSMVDALLTGGQEEFDAHFIVAEFPNISDNLIQITKLLFDRYHDRYKSINAIPEDILAATGKECDYYSNDKYESYRIKLIKENCSNYYSLLFLSLDKTLVNTDDYKAAQECVNELKTNQYTKWYFKENLPFEEDDGIERLYQLKFKGSYKDLQLRCMFDELIVDHKNKIIYPIDLKTSFKKEWEFYKSFIDWGYWHQSQLYAEILMQNISKDEYFKDFQVKNYRFIVICRHSLLPLVWEFTETFNSEDTEYITKQGGKIILPNWRNVVTELDYYLKSKPKYPLKISNLNSIGNWLLENGR